ncbi:unnamed protein product [Gongylonema pulchrum]|uniref:Maltase n=1 Tax=Gongylonema pulchrum TaxID=637853 RepID=A0A3P6NYB3_9BILA|nr:unnamed protein product [Gongylonema pulchrum]
MVKTRTGALNPYGTDLSPINVQISNSDTVLNVRIGTEGRYEPTIPLPRASIRAKQQYFTVETSYESELFVLRIHRAKTRKRIWDTSIGGLLFADQYIQIATFLPTDKIYGFGENVHLSLKHEFFNYTTWSMLARDQPPDPANKQRNLYGVHPFYLGLEGDNKAHGVLIWNSNPQEITTGPGPHLIYRTIGGMLDITFFAGPTPEEVIQQYHSYIGLPSLPAYFALGFQFCRYGYKNLLEMKETIERIRNAKIPIDVAYADIDYMERYKDFTISEVAVQIVCTIIDDFKKKKKNHRIPTNCIAFSYSSREGSYSSILFKKYWRDFKSYADELHKQNMHLILIFDPAIEVDYPSFQRALQKNVSFIEWENYEQVPHEIQDKYSLTKGTKVSRKKYIFSTNSSVC